MSLKQIGGLIESTPLNDNFKYLDDSLAAHNAEKAQDNVHGLGDRPMVSMNNVTYYVDAMIGSDNNDGLSASTPLKTWVAVMRKIPRYIIHNVTINVIGNLPEKIIVPSANISNNNLLIIQGNTTTPSNQVVNGIEIYSFNGGRTFEGIFVQYFRVNGLIGIYGGYGILITNCEPRNSGGKGIEAKYCIAHVRSCDFGTNVVQDAIYAVQSRIYAENNTGNATQYGLHATQTSTIGKFGTQPSGTVANDQTSGGGIIR